MSQMIELIAIIMLKKMSQYATSLVIVFFAVVLQCLFSSYEFRPNIS